MLTALRLEGVIMSAAVQSSVWDEILRVVKSTVSRETLETWFLPIRFDKLDKSGQRIHLHAPNQLTRDWVVSNYSILLDKSLCELDLAGYSFAWVIDEDNPCSQRVPPPIADLPRESLQGSALHPSTVITAGSTPHVQITERSLNSKYTFESFVVGSCNQFAHAASLAVAEAPGKTYNPLFLYGGVGLGKTHLMHACGHQIKQRNQHLELCYISSEKFMNELINAIRYDKTQNFREKYRSVDVLLIDDVQFMAGKERTQEEFFHTFNALYEQQKQIVISSDCPPREIPTLEERLHSRFEWGLIADLEPPDLETKVAILKRKAELMGITLDDDIALFIASRVKNNVRELEGSLIRLIAISSLRGQPISRILAQDAIRNIAVDDDAGVLTIEQIQKAVAQSYRLTMSEIVAKSNARHYALPRQVAMYICKQLTKHSYPEIGRAFGGKHHTTVIHSVEKIEALLSTDSNLRKRVREISDIVQK
jgi:chromosomal replication initiator protein